MGNKLTAKGALRRETILESAARLFDEVGYHQTSIALIAEDAETTKANIYHYFRAKHDILAAIYDNWIDVLTEMFEDHVRHEPDVGRAVTLVFRDLMTVILENPSQVRVYFHYARELPPHQRDEAQAKRDHYWELVESVIQRGIDAGIFPPQPTRAATLGLLGMCAWASQWTSSEASLASPEIADYFANVFLNGVRSGSVSSQA
jgi:AcrR family transcriptional regulator